MSILSFLQTTVEQSSTMLRHRIGRAFALAALTTLTIAAPLSAPPAGLKGRSG